MTTTYYNFIGFLLFLLVLISYCMVFRNQWNYRKVETYRLQVLSTRVALFLPVYAFFILISLLVPSSFQLLEILISIAEGLSFYSFFALIVENLGGPTETVKYMRLQNRDLFLNCNKCFCPSDYYIFFNRVKIALFHTLVTRSIIVLFMSITYGYEEKYGQKAKKLYILFSIISFLFVANGFGSLVLFFENIMKSSENILGFPKIFLVKLSIVFIVLQYLILEVLNFYNLSYQESANGWSKEDRSQRLYCFVVLIEYGIMSIFLYLFYGGELTRNTELEGTLNTGFRTPSQATIEQGFYNPEQGLTANVTFCGFLCDVLNYPDMYNSLSLTSTNNNALSSQSSDSAREAMIHTMNNPTHGRNVHGIEKDFN